MSASNQWIRKALLLVFAGDKGRDLSKLQFKFTITASDFQTPNTARIMIYNLSDATAMAVVKESTKVVLNAGYQNGNFGQIFSGSIVQYRKGKLDASTTFLEILASDGDLAYNFGLVNTNLGASATSQEQQVSTICSQAFSAYGVTNPNAPASFANSTVGGTLPLPRGKVMFGMGKDFMRGAMKNVKARWSIQNGVVTIVPYTSYLPGTALVLTAKTGLIGQPEATNDGILVKCLLNPNISIGTQVKIDNKDINTNTVVNRSVGYPGYKSFNFPATTANDGIYRVLVVEHEGDTRGQEWYSNLTCLAISSSAAPASSVAQY